jgi:hypothetical protein
MDRAFSCVVNLTIVSLGAYLCTYALYERRAAVFGACLIALGAGFGVADYWRGNASPALAPDLPDD